MKIILIKFFFDVFKLRFIHNVLNDTVGKNVDVYSIKLQINIFRDIASNTVTEFKELAFIRTTISTYNKVDTFIVRKAGGTFELGRLVTASNPPSYKVLKPIL